MTAAWQQEQQGNDDPREILTAQEAARLCGITDQTLTYHLARGNLVGRKLGRVWITTVTAVRQFLATRRGPGRPPLHERGGGPKPAAGDPPRPPGPRRRQRKPKGPSADRGDGEPDACTARAG